MKDQHTMIKGYRDLSQEEIDQMNAMAKEMAEQVKILVDTVDQIAEVAESLVPTPPTD